MLLTNTAPLLHILLVAEDELLRVVDLALRARPSVFLVELVEALQVVVLDDRHGRRVRVVLLLAATALRWWTTWTRTAESATVGYRPRMYTTTQFRKKSREHFLIRSLNGKQNTAGQERVPGMVRGVACLDENWVETPDIQALVDTSEKKTFIFNSRDDRV